MTDIRGCSRLNKVTEDDTENAEGSERKREVVPRIAITSCTKTRDEIEAILL